MYNRNCLRTNIMETELSGKYSRKGKIIRMPSLNKDELYYQHPYIREFDAIVTSCVPVKKKWNVILDSSAFYPEGGGQLPDTGTIGGVEVTDTQRIDGKIVHTVTAPLVEGTEVHAVIDWDLRLAHMQGHSGEHIVSGLIHREFGYDNVGFHMSTDHVTVDFDGPITQKQLESIEEEANRIIFENIPITATFPDAETLETIPYRSKKRLSGVVRIVTVPKADICACCGTHVASTGEIGLIHLTNLSTYKGGVRFDMYCGLEALADYRAKDIHEHKIMQLFSAKPEETSDKAALFVEKAAGTEEKLNEITKKYIDLKLETLSPSRLVIMCEDGLEAQHNRRFCEEAVTSGKAHTAVSLSRSKDAFNYIIRSDESDLRAISGSLNKKLSGRGGGQTTMIQGRFSAPLETILTTLKEAFGD